MMNKNDFCNLVNDLRKIYHKEIQLADALGGVFEDYPILTINGELESHLIDYINKNIGTKDEDVLSWWLYENEDKSNCIIYNEDKSIYKVLDTTEKLYDYMSETSHE